MVRERRLGRLLDRELGPVAIVMHDRDATGADAVVDHLVVAASGVWVIDAVHAKGKVERRRGLRRDGEAWLATVDGGRVALPGPCAAHLDVVRGHLERMGFGWLDVHRAVCLTNADWGVLSKPFEVDGTFVTWGRALVDEVAVPGALAPRDMRAVAMELAARLPSAR